MVNTFPIPAYPEFTSDYLAEIVAALRMRSKGITYHAPGWSCTREIESEDGTERLNVDLDVFDSQMRLSIWADCKMWFRACAGGKNGWEFMLSFHGDCTSAPPEEMVDLLKQSLALPNTQLLDIWRSVSPEIEQSESKA